MIPSFEFAAVSLGTLAAATIMNIVAVSYATKDVKTISDSYDETIENLKCQIDTLTTTSDQYKTIMHMQMKLFLDLLDTTDPEQYYMKIQTLHNLVQQYNAEHTFESYRDILDESKPPVESYQFMDQIMRSYFRMDTSMLQYLDSIKAQYETLLHDQDEAVVDMDESYQSAKEQLSELGIQLVGQHNTIGHTMLVSVKENSYHHEEEKENSSAEDRYDSTDP